MTEAPPKEPRSRSLPPLMAVGTIFLPLVRYNLALALDAWPLRGTGGGALSFLRSAAALIRNRYKFCAHNYNPAFICGNRALMRNRGCCLVARRCSPPSPSSSYQIQT
jgi:hypothetical protein